MTPLRAGVAWAPSSADLPAGAVQRFVATARDSGFAHIWALDNPLADQAEPLILLAMAAALDDGLGVGTSAVIAPVRDPVLLAKQIATLDRITGGGRVTVGLTIGRRTTEYDLIGHDFRRRGAILDDVVRVMRQHWRGEPLNVEGVERTWKTDRPIGLPPATSGGPTILLGGQAERALVRAVALGDGYLASAAGGPSSALRNIARVQELCDTAGRDATTFRTVANVFVVTAPTRQTAIELAAAAMSARHPGAPPPWDPNEVVVGGPPDQIADHLAELLDAGYDSVTLVPVVGSIEQVRALAPVVDSLRSPVVGVGDSSTRTRTR